VSLTEGIKFVFFNNKTVLELLPLDMVASFWWSYSTLTHLAQDILKVGTGRIWVLRAAPVAPFDNDYHSLYSFE
jgi:hypothetical protein